MTTPAEWLLGDDTGVSSMTICAVMTGSPISWPSIPHDPGDFGRCYRLLKLFPEWVARMPEVAARYPDWGPLVAAWPELTAMYEEILRQREAHGEMRYPRARSRLRLSKREREELAAYEAHPTTVAYDAMYERMSALHDACMIAGGWRRTGESSWEKGGAK